MAESVVVRDRWPSSRFAPVALALVLAACVEVPVAAPEDPVEVVPGRTFSTPQMDVGLWVATHSTGIYVSGYSEGAMPGPVVGDRDPFVRKYHPDGELLWEDQFGSSQSEIPFELLVNASGEAYVVGQTLGSLAGSRGGSDVFMRKYDIDGNVLWTRQLGTTRDDIAYGAALQLNGDLVVVGSTDGVMASGGGDTIDAFVRRISPDGEVIWTRQFGASGGTQAVGVAVDGGGEIYVVGTTKGLLGADSAGQGDAFIRKYHPGGGIAWTRQFGTPEYDLAQRVRVDGSGEVLVLGQTGGDLAGSSGGSDIFVRRYASGGGVIATRQFGSTETELAWGLAIDPADNYYVYGHTTGDIAGVVGGQDLFLRKFSNTDNVRYTRQFGTSTAEEAYGIAVLDASTLFIAGSTQGAFVGDNRGSWDAFASRLNGNGTVIWTDQ